MGMELEHELEQELGLPGIWCEVGGDFLPQLYGPAIYDPPCENPPMYRYHDDQMVPGWWNYRCGRHIRDLSPDLPDLIIERF